MQLPTIHNDNDDLASLSNSRLFWPGGAYSAVGPFTKDPLSNTRRQRVSAQGVGSGPAFQLLVFDIHPTATTTAHDDAVISAGDSDYDPTLLNRLLVQIGATLRDRHSGYAK